MKRVALVTGGTRGIGLGIARALAADGFELALCGVREEKDVAPVLAELRAPGTATRYFRADIGEKTDRVRLVSEVKEAFGRLHVLVNNAGVAPQARVDLLEAGEDSFERLLRVNLQGPYFLTQGVARWMLEQKGASEGWSGCVVNVTSISATVASTNRGEYCVSKAGLAMASQLWAVRLAEVGIPVYEVRPGHHPHRHDRRGGREIRPPHRRGAHPPGPMGHARGRGPGRRRPRSRRRSLFDGGGDRGGRRPDPSTALIDPCPIP